MVELACLNLVQWDDDSPEKLHMLRPKRDCKSRNDGGEYVQELGYPVELKFLVDEGVELVGHGFSDHLPSWDQLGIKSVENILQVFSFSGLLRIEEPEELLDEGVGDENLQGFDIAQVVEDQLIEQFINGLVVVSNQL